MKIKVSSGFSGVIATGSYENMRPSYMAEIETDIPDDLGNELTQKAISDNLKRLQEICLANFKNDEQKAIVDRINREREDIRFYGEFPSVTSIINWDADFFVSKEELVQYASQGNLIDASAKDFVLTGKKRALKDISGTWTDIVICTQGSLKLPIDGWDFEGFLKKYPIEKLEIGKPVTSQKHKYAGTPDFRIGYYEGKKYLIDVKRTPEKVKNGKQLAAYIKAEEENGESPYEGGLIAPVNDKTEQGFSKPIIYTRESIEQYFLMFLNDRESFKRRFNA